MLPTVSIIRKYPDSDVDMVGLDNEEGVDIPVRHLHGMGHRKIGFFGRSNQVHWGRPALERMLPRWKVSASTTIPGGS